MKTITTFLIAAALTTTAARAQYVVTDPISDVLSEEMHLEDIAKWVQSINNQVQQINTLTQQLQQIQAYVKAVGDPKQFLNIVGANELISSLNTSGVGTDARRIAEPRQRGGGDDGQCERALPKHRTDFHHAWGYAHCRGRRCCLSGFY